MLLFLEVAKNNPYRYEMSELGVSILHGTSVPSLGATFPDYLALILPYLDHRLERCATLTT